LGAEAQNDRRSKVTTFAWVIEDAESQPSAPRYYTLAPGKLQFWSEHHTDALRFARREDAVNYAEHFIEAEKPRFAEHGWE
jgi:hypothetical protein